MFGSIAELVTRRGWLVILAWLAFFAALKFFAPPWSTVSRDDDVRFFPPGYPSVIGQGLLESGFPDDTAGSSVVVLTERPEGELTQADQVFLADLQTSLRQLAVKKPDLGLMKVVGPDDATIGNRLIQTGRNGGQVALTAVQLRRTFASKEARLAVDAVLGLLDELRAKAPEGLRLAITGNAAVGHDSNTAANQSIEATTIGTVVLVIMILLVVYRSPLLALIPLVTIVISAWTALMLIALMATPPLNFQVINVTGIFVVVVLFGAGTDYCLFLIARYREELARGRTPDAAIAESIRQVGGALVASAGTVIVGLGMLWFSTFAKIQYTGPSIALSLIIALVAALTLAPVLLRLLKKAVFWPYQPPEHMVGQDVEEETLRETPMFGFWAGIANLVVRRPGLILVASIGVLLPFAWIGTQTTSSYDIVADLGSDQPSVTGNATFRRYYPEGEIGPSTILVRQPSIDFTNAEGIAAISSLSERLVKLPGVVEVRSLTRPLGQPIPILPRQPAPPPKPSEGGGLLTTIGNRIRQGIDAKIREEQGRAFDRYVSVGRGVGVADKNHITRIDVIFDASPFSEEAMVMLDRVAAETRDATESGPLKGAEIGLAGTTVQIDDLKSVVTADERRMYVLVTAGVYLILVVLLRKPGICLYLIATVVLGYLASLGLTELVFRAWQADAGPWLGLDWKVGFFLFVILVAVGEDYNIFLMSRVIEEERKHGAIEGTRRAVAHTGGIISSCGVIMAGTFGAMIFGSLASLKQLGFALALGVLLDTFVVRPVLVPAFVVLWHRTFPRAKLEGAGLPHDEPEAATSSV